MSQNFNVKNEQEMLSLNASAGDIAMRHDIGKSFVLKTEPASNINNWIKILFPEYVNSVNGKDGVVTLTTDIVPEENNLYFTEERVEKVIDNKIGDMGLNDFIGNEKIVMEDDILTLNCGSSQGNYQDIEDNDEIPPFTGPVPQHTHVTADIEDLDKTLEESINSGIGTKLEDIRFDMISADNKIKKEVLDELSKKIENNTISIPEATPDTKGILKLYTKESIKDNATKITDGTMDVATISSYLEESKKQFNDLASKSGLPIGFMYFSFNTPENEPGSLPLNGTEYSIELYEDLWKWAQDSGRTIVLSEYEKEDRENNGNVPYFTDCGNGNFRVPKIKAYTVGTESEKSIGKYLEAGLPNHIHEISVRRRYGKDPMSDSTPGWDTGDRYYSEGRVSTSSGNPIGSSIYGKSDTVRPESLVGMWYIKAYGVITNKGAMDLDRVLKDYSYFKHDIETILKALPTRYVVKTYKYKNDWYEQYNDGWLRQGGKIHLKEQYEKQIVSLNKPFSDTYFSCICQETSGKYPGKIEYANGILISPETTNSISFVNGSYETDVYWITEGQGIVEK